MDQRPAADARQGTRQRRRPPRTGGGPSRRASLGRGPSAEWRRPRPVAPATFLQPVDRAEHLRAGGAPDQIPCRLFGPTSAARLPLVIAWGSGRLVSDESWAREIADRTGALVVLAALPDDPDAAFAAATAVYSDVVLRAGALGARPDQIAVTGRGRGFRVAAQLATESRTWPAVTTPLVCVAAHSITAAAAVLREALHLPADQPRLQSVRAGLEVRTADGQLLGRVAHVADGALTVFCGLSEAELFVPVRAVAHVRGAVTLSVAAHELPRRDWARRHPLAVAAAERPTPPSMN